MQENTEIPRSVAIVGRPNVGKSRLFNRLVGRRVSIVHDMPGVTRDLITEEVRDGNYLLMDTGGIGLFTKLTPKVIADAVEEQVGFAVNAAGVVLFVVDVNEGCAPLDLEIAARLRRFGKRVILVANKADNEARAANQADFFPLGLGAPVLISAEHGTGIPFLVEKIKAALGPAAEAAPDGGRIPADGAGSTRTAPAPRIRLCLVGRPNVGKSSIGNRLLDATRLIVSEVAGTTRDPVRALFSREGRVFELVDTAGRRASTRQDALDYYSTLRSDEMLAAADVALLVLDARSGVTRLDKQLAGQVAAGGAGIVLVVNKWDLAQAAFKAGNPADAALEGFESESDFRARYLESVRREFFFLPGAPVLFVSATTGLNVEALLGAASEVASRQTAQLSTGRLNKTIHDLMERQPPRMVSGKRFKCYYAVQAGVKPVRIRLFCNSSERVEDAYTRYLLAGLRAAFDLSGAAVELEFIGKPKDPDRQFFTPQRIDSSAKSVPSAARSPRPVSAKPAAGKKAGGKSAKGRRASTKAASPKRRATKR
ncbi:MAG: ribosome biogenesis GTPase Der [Puniceicoccales bacterium]|jgi:GTP-binding protein|nr:ribosome biogenesis GTPase Der [Puniceicoccales bacterium]